MAVVPKGGIATGDFKEWLSAAKVKAALQRIRGAWMDDSGSYYTLSDGGSYYTHGGAAGSGRGLDVETVRAVGDTRKGGHTSALVHIEWKGELGRVVFGKGPSSSYYTISSFDGKTLVWDRSGSRCIKWERVKVGAADTVAEDTPDVKTNTAFNIRSQGTGKCEKKAERGAVVHRAPWAHLRGGDAISSSTCSTRSPMSPSASPIASPLSSAGEDATCPLDSSGPPPELQEETQVSELPESRLGYPRRVPDDEKIIKISDITGLEKDKACELLASHQSDVEQALRAHIDAAKKGKKAAADTPPPARQPPCTMATEKAPFETTPLPPPAGVPVPPLPMDTSLKSATVAKMSSILGIDMDNAHELLVEQAWNFEKAVRAYVRLRGAEELHVPPPPPPRHPPSQKGGPKSEGIAVGEEVWAYFSDAWHPVLVFGLQPDGFFQVVWTDGSTSTLPRGVIAAHGEPVLIGDSVITFFSGDWYLATVNKLLPRGAVEVLWDDGTVSEVPLLHTFRVPE